MNLFMKRAIDFLGGIAGFSVASPLVLAAGAAIFIHDGRPILFRQKRPGKDGRPFNILKFRTMRELKPGETWIDSDSARLSTLGKLLRETSIDELPTLINVIKGDMSLVGPRPLLMQYLERYNEEQARRHEIKPGITGWAQINGRNNVSWEEKFKMDVWYVDNQSFFLDLKILLQTIKKVVSRDDVAYEGTVTTHEFMGNES